MMMIIDSVSIVCTSINYCMSVDNGIKLQLRFVSDNHGFDQFHVQLPRSLTEDRLMSFHLL